MSVLRLLCRCAVAAAVAVALFAVPALSQSDYWESARGQFRDPVTAVVALPHGVVFAGTGSSEEGGSLYRSTDAGIHWQQMPLAISTSAVRAIRADTTGHVLVGTADGFGAVGVYTSNDAGGTWKASGLTVPVSMFATGRKDTILAATASGIYWSADAGSSWMATGFTRKTYSVAADSPGVLLAGTTGYTTYSPAQGGGATIPTAHSGMIYRSEDGGESWVEVYGANGTAYSLLFASSSVAFAAMGDRGIGRSLDTGRTWTAFNAGLPFGADVRCLTLDAENTVLAGTTQGTLYRLLQGKETWEALAAAADSTSQILSISTAGDLLFAGTDDVSGFLLRSTDRGTNWIHPGGVLESPWVYTLRVTAPGSVIAGTQHGVFVSTDEGDSWARGAGDIGTQTVYSTAESKSGVLWATAGEAGLFSSRDQGTTWSRVGTIPSSYYSQVAADGRGRVFVTGSATVMRSTDDGASWMALSHSGDGFLFAAKSGVVILRDSAGLVNRSTDGGDHWQVSAGIVPSNTLYAVAEDSAGVLYAGTYTGVFSSSDSGASWKKLLDRETHCLAANAAGYVFRGEYGTISLVGPTLSKNGGVSWRDIGSGLGSHFGLAALAINAGGRIFAGTVDGGVYRSRTSSLPVVLATLQGVPLPAGGVKIEWTTLQENALRGFSVERSVQPSGSFAELPGSYIPAAGTAGKTMAYSYVDTTAAKGIVYYYRLRQVGADSDISFSHGCAVQFTSAVAEAGETMEFALGQNWPNPFNPSTNIAYTVHGSGFMVHGTDVKLTVYDLLGREVAVLVNEKQAPGRYSVRFDATNLASGMYLYRLQAGDFVETRRMLLLR